MVKHGDLDSFKRMRATRIASHAAKPTTGYPNDDCFVFRCHEGSEEHRLEKPFTAFSQNPVGRANFLVDNPKLKCAIIKKHVSMQSNIPLARSLIFVKRFQRLSGSSACLAFTLAEESVH